MPTLTDKDLSEIEAQIDGSVPYYVTSLIESIRTLLTLLDTERAASAALREELEVRREHWRDAEQPFQEWAQSYLDSARWAGHDWADAIKTELLERDQQVASLSADLAQLRMLIAATADDMEQSGSDAHEWADTVRDLARKEPTD